MSLAQATSLNDAKLRTVRFADPGPFKSITKREFLESLKRSEDDIKHGRVKDARVAVEEIFSQHGY